MQVYDFVDPRFHELVVPTASLEKLVEDFRWLEGPAFENGHTRDREGRLISFSHRGRYVTRTEIDGRITVFADRYKSLRLEIFNSINICSLIKVL